MKTLYIMLTKNNTLFCKLITTFSRHPYAHVSLLFSDNFTEGFSFSRKNINNPLIGGFKLENYPLWVAKFPTTYCQIYTLEVSDSIYQNLHNTIHNLYNEKDKYTYNLVGVIGRTLHLRIAPENSYFCSQFVAYILGETDTLHFDKPHICVTPEDFATHPSLSLTYEGPLSDLLSDPTLADSFQESFA